MGRGLGDGLLRFCNGAWRDDDGDAVDIVEVVRCKDCKNRGDLSCPMYSEKYIEFDDDGYFEYDIVKHDPTFDDGFCDRAEREDDENP